MFYISNITLLIIIIIIIIIIINNNKGTPIQAIKAHGGCACNGRIYTAKALGRDMVLVLRSAAFTPGQNPGTHFIGG